MKQREREKKIYLPIKTVSITQKEYNKCKLNGGLLERHKCPSRLTAQYICKKNNTLQLHILFSFSSVNHRANGQI